MAKNRVAPSTEESTHCGPRRRLLQTLLLSLLGISAFMMVAQVTDLGSAVTSFHSKLKSQSGQGQLRQTLTPEQLKAFQRRQKLVVQRTKAPFQYATEELKRKCYAERDMGILSAVPVGASHFCANGGWDSVKQMPMSAEKATKVTTYQVAGGLWGTTFQNLMLDLVDVQIYRPIESMAHDGGAHDPRFDYNPRLVNCACDELAAYFAAMPDAKMWWDKQMWVAALWFNKDEGLPNATTCVPWSTRPAAPSSWDFVHDPFVPPDGTPLLVFDNPVVLIPRRDDHNPFFQVSYALNAWIMLQGLHWDVSKTIVVHLDGGYPSPIDALHHKLLAPNHDLIDGNTLMGKRVHFRGDVLLAPFETYGPMMQHLNDDEPCYDSELFRRFRAQSLLTQNVTPAVERALSVTSIRPMIVTVITRRPYQGRTLQRQWINEDEILGLMRTEFRGFNVLIRSVEYVNLTLQEQMKTTIESDLLISMHGAGLVNVLWTRPMTTVVEIFPKNRHRWGYRNLCRFIGCNWYEFRGGVDVSGGDDPNAQNKRIHYPEWMAFFKPLFNETYDALAKQQAILRGQEA